MKDKLERALIVELAPGYIPLLLDREWRPWPHPWWYIIALDGHGYRADEYRRYGWDESGERAYRFQLNWLHDFIYILARPTRLTPEDQLFYLPLLPGATDNPQYLGSHNIMVCTHHNGRKPLERCINYGLQSRWRYANGGEFLDKTPEEVAKLTNRPAGTVDWNQVHIPLQNFQVFRDWAQDHYKEIELKFSREGLL